MPSIPGRNSRLARLAISDLRFAFEIPKARDGAYTERWRRVKKGRDRKVVGRKVVGADLGAAAVGFEAGFTGI